jgi:hypothetical protein
MTAAGLQSALDFLNALPALASAGRIDVAAIPARVDYPALTTAAAACGYRFDADDIAEAFRLLLRTRLVTTAGPR